MIRAVVRQFAQPAEVELVTEATPVPAAGEIVVEVDAAGVSFVDNLIAKGRYQVRPPLPYTPGSTAAGRVIAVGEGVDSPAVGDGVAALLTSYGGFASHLHLPAAAVVPLPDGVSAPVAATAIENYSTALFAVTHRVRIEPGMAVVVLGAGGGIGLAAVDVAHGLGARVVAVASSADKRAAARAAGADHAIDYRDLKARIREVTGGGADVVIDPVGGDAAEAALRALAPGGRFCVLGFASGEIPRLPANIVLLGNRGVIGVDWGDWSRKDHPAALELVSEVLARTAAGTIHPPRPRVLPLREAAQAMRSYEDRDVVGKLALRP